jgi:hypothetical protein
VISANSCRPLVTPSLYCMDIGTVPARRWSLEHQYINFMITSSDRNFYMIL